MYDVAFDVRLGADVGVDVDFQIDVGGIFYADVEV